VKQKAAVREEPEEEEFDFEKPSEETWEMPLDDTEEKHE
jgi:hypothetical protein